MLAFMLGFILGAVLLLGLLWWWVGLDSPAFTAARAMQDLADLERQTLQRLMAAEMAARRTPGAPSSMFPGNDIVEGTATEVERPCR